MRFWGFQVYDAACGSHPAFGDGYAAHPLALELTYLRDFTARPSPSAPSPRCAAGKLQRRAGAALEARCRLLPDVKPGDRLTGLYRPGGVRVSTTAKPLGDVRDEEFARLFFGIWLSPHTSEPALRRQLLAGSAGAMPCHDRRQVLPWRRAWPTGCWACRWPLWRCRCTWCCPTTMRASSACRWPRWAPCCWRRGCLTPSSTR
jgi:hypothetical protein